MLFKKLKNASILVLSLTCTLFLGACSSSPDKEGAEDSAGDANGAPAKSLDTENPESADADGKNGNLQTVYFDFDKYDIRADQRQSADANAKYLKDNSAVKVEIQGNCDDRGSAEYNLALGTRRAYSLKKYLVTSGVDASRITTVSFGKERPAEEGATEEAWSKNRRDDVVVKK